LNLEGFDTMAKRIFLSVLALCVCLCWPEPAAANEDYEFALGLKEMGYVDLASEQFGRMQKAKDATPDDKRKASLGLADLYEEAAGDLDPESPDTPGEKEKYLSQAVTQLAGFLKANPKDPEAAELRYRKAQIQIERGNIAIEFVVDAAKPEEKKKHREKAQQCLKDAQKEMNGLAEAFKGLADKVRKSGRSKEIRKQADILRGRALEAELEVPRVSYFLAKAYDEKAPERKKLLEGAAEQYKKFTKEHKGMLITMEAQRGEGLCYHRLGKFTDAVKTFHKALRTQRREEASQIRQLIYHDKMVSCLAAKDYDEASRTARGFDQEVGEDDSELARAVRIQGARSLAAQGERLWKKDQKEAKVYYDAAFRVAGKVSAKGGLWGRTADELVAIWLKKTGLKPKAEDPRQLFGHAEGLFAEEKWLNAIHAYQNAVVAAGERESEKNLVGDSWFKIGYAYYNLGRAYEAALAFGELGENYAAHKLAMEAAYFSVQLFAHLYEQGKTPYDMDRYVEGMLALAKNHPDHSEASNMRFMIAEVMRGRNDFHAAAENYAAVRPDSEHYERASYFAGLCYWLEFNQRAQEGPDAAQQNVALVQKAMTAFDSFLTWSAQLPKIKPERVPLGEEWVANTKVRLASICVSEWGKKPKECLDLLTNFTKEHPKHAGLFADALFAREKGYLQTDQLDQAEQCLNQLNEKHKDYVFGSDACRLLGVRYADEGAALIEKGSEAGAVGEKAAKYLSLALAKKPDAPMDDYTWVGTGLFKIRRYADAAKVFTNLIDKFGQGREDSSEIWDTKIRLADTYKAMKSWDQAVPLYAAIVERFPDVIDYRKDMATCYELNEQYVDALDQWRAVSKQAVEPSATQDSPDWFLAKRRMIICYCRADNPQQAYNILAFTKQMHPKLGGPESEKAFMAILEKEFQAEYRTKFAELEKEIAGGAAEEE